MSQPVTEHLAMDGDTFEKEIVPAFEPVVLRGQVAAWPAVAAGRRGAASIAAYMLGFARDASTELMVAPPATGGRLFYRDDMSGFNFRRGRMPLHDFIAELLRIADQPEPPTLYASAAAADEHLPGWTDANPLDLRAPGGTARLWIGNATRVATHFDMSPNIACVVAGRRHFTLFPPEQMANLYCGPLDHTVAGPPTSMVDHAAPDLARYPRFAEAAAHARMVTLEPGDAIFIPATWWHAVDATASVNLLVNYWWPTNGAYSPFVAMIHALAAVRDLPPSEKAVWRAWFDHYVFGDDAAFAADHLPDHARGLLAPAGAAQTAALDAYLRGRKS